MNKDQIEGRWKQLTGTLKEKWGRLIDDETTVIAGVRGRLEGSLQERHGHRWNTENGEIQSEGTDQWKAIDARVNCAFSDLRMILDCDRENVASGHSQSQAISGERR